MANFEIDPATEILAVGSVDEHSARIWVRASIPGPHELVLRTSAPAARKTKPQQNRNRLIPTSDNRAVDDETANADKKTIEFSVSTDPSRDNIVVVTAEGLGAGLRYDFEVSRRADKLRPTSLLGSGSFRTTASAHRPGDRMTVATMSCHQPFDEHGRVRSDAKEMLAKSNSLLRERDVDFVLMLGDQMYSDAPAACSLFNTDHFSSLRPEGPGNVLECDAAEIRRLYQDRYRRFWAVPGWQELLRNRPCYPCADDHEFVDNWGSDPAHDTTKWAAIRSGALQAYFDYQGSRALPIAACTTATPPEPATAHYSFRNGPVGVMVTDMRSRRSIERGHLFGPEQLADIERFLADSRDLPVAILATSLPLFHVPRAAAALGGMLTGSGDDFSDRAIHPAFAEEFGQVCKLLHEHCQRARDQQLILVGGDVHLGAISELRWDSGAKAVQLISSGITRKPERGVTLLSSLAVRAHHATEPTTDHEPHADLVASDAEHPFLGCNLALIELEMQQDGRWSTDLSIHGVTEQRFGCIVQHAVSAP